MDIPDLLIAAADLGVTVSLGKPADGGPLTPIMTGRTSAITPELRSELKARKVEIKDYLTAANTCLMTGYGLYVSKSLKTRHLPDSITGSPPCLFVDSEPFYRLSPDVLAWTATALERAMPHMTEAEREAAYVVFEGLRDIVTREFPPHLVRMAYRRKAGLPPMPEVITVPDWPKEAYFAKWKAANSPSAN